MEIKHKHIRDAVLAWADCPGGRKIPVTEIVDAYRSLGISDPKLFDDSHPDALSRNIQKIFRWIETDTRASVENIRLLLPAIEKAMPTYLLAVMRSHSSVLLREAVERRKRIDCEVEALFGAMIALSGRIEGSGPSGSGMRAN